MLTWANLCWLTLNCTNFHCLFQFSFCSIFVSVFILFHFPFCFIFYSVSFSFLFYFPLCYSYLIKINFINQHLYCSNRRLYVFTNSAINKIEANYRDQFKAARERDCVCFSDTSSNVDSSSIFFRLLSSAVVVCCGLYNQKRETMLKTI